MAQTTHGGPRKGAGAKLSVLTLRVGHKIKLTFRGEPAVVTVERIEYVGRKKQGRIAYGVDQVGQPVTIEI